jgi:hypothetical protein
VYKVVKSRSKGDLMMNTPTDSMLNVSLPAPRSTLRRAMRGNALFSAVSGLVSLLAAGPLAAFMGLQPPLIFVVLGLLLLAYAALLTAVTSGEQVERKYGLAATVMDVAWVAGSVLILLTGQPELTVAGRWTVGLLAEAVAFFAVWQAYGLRRN